MKQLKGIPGAPGKAMLPAVVHGRRDFAVEKRAVPDQDGEHERFQQARSTYLVHINALYEKTLERLVRTAPKSSRPMKPLPWTMPFSKSP